MQINGSRAGPRKRFGHMFEGEGDNRGLGLKHQHVMQIKSGGFSKEHFNDTFSCGCRCMVIEIQHDTNSTSGTKAKPKHVAPCCLYKCCKCCLKNSHSSTKQWCSRQRPAHLEAFHKAFSASSKLNKQTQASGSTMIQIVVGRAYSLNQNPCPPWRFKRLLKIALPPLTPPELPGGIAPATNLKNNTARNGGLTA